MLISVLILNFVDFAEDVAHNKVDFEVVAAAAARHVVSVVVSLTCKLGMH